MPFLTETGTIGIVDIAHGTAWDTGIPADPGVYDLGVGDLHDVYAAAQMPNDAGTVSLDGQPVQHHGTAVVDGRPVYPTAPDGWRQISLPVWRGYDDDRGCYVDVPVWEYAPDTWIRPRLVASGLMTCYGKPGDAENGEYLTVAHHPWLWPHGVPQWVKGQSTTVLDLLAHASGQPRPGSYVSFSLSYTKLPRGSDAEEMERLAPFLDAARAEVATSLRRWNSHLPDSTVDDIAEALNNNTPATHSMVDALEEAHRRIPYGERNSVHGSDTLATLNAVKALAVADQAAREEKPGYPWVAAHAIANERLGITPGWWPNPHMWPVPDSTTPSMSAT